MRPVLKNIDTFCGRLNAGLAAVAVVLTILVAAELTVRLPDLFQQAAIAAGPEATTLANSSSGASTGAGAGAGAGF
jgi:hypothetical protein